MTIPSNPAYLNFDAAAARRWWLRRAVAAPWLHEEIGRRMVNRLDFIRAQPGVWAHWAPLHGGLEAHALVAEKYPGAVSYLVEPEFRHSDRELQALRGGWLSARRWRQDVRVVVEPPAAGVGMVWSNMGLHACDAPMDMLAAWHRCLSPDGFLMFSCLGPDTAKELREVYGRLGWGEPAAPLMDMHDWGDLLVQFGFAEPVMDMEVLTLTWASSDAMLAELRQLGKNVHPGRFQGLRGRHWLGAWHEAMVDMATRSPDGRCCLSFELIFGHAFKPAPGVPVGRETRIPLEEMRVSLRQRK